MSVMGYTGPESLTPDAERFLMAEIARFIAREVYKLISPEIAKMTPVLIRPALLDVKQAATYLGRSEQSVQQLIFKNEFPVVRVGRRVHLHRPDLDKWIEKNKY
jgi:excisionase family DNA binding protein